MSGIACVEIKRLHEELRERLPKGVLEQIEMNVAGDALSIRLDGARCLTSIGIWPNGCCDVDYMFVASEKGEFTHFEFENTEAALSGVLRVVKQAAERA